MIYGDKDADGVTAASIIYNTLKAVTKNVEAFVPNHEVGYGLSKDVIESYANSGVSLIITVDCGISNVEEVEFSVRTANFLISSDLKTLDKVALKTDADLLRLIGANEMIIEEIKEKLAEYNAHLGMRG